MDISLEPQRSGLQKQIADMQFVLNQIEELISNDIPSIQRMRELGDRVSKISDCIVASLKPGKEWKNWSLYDAVTYLNECIVREKNKD